MAAKKRKKSKSKLNMTLILLVAVIILGGYYMYTGNDPLGLFTELEDMEVPAVDGALTEGAGDAEGSEAAPAPVVDTSVQGD